VSDIRNWEKSTHPVLIQHTLGFEPNFDGLLHLRLETSSERNEKWRHDSSRTHWPIPLFPMVGHSWLFSLFSKHFHRSRNQNHLHKVSIPTHNTLPVALHSLTSALHLNSIWVCFSWPILVWTVLTAQSFWSRSHCVVFVKRLRFCVPQTDCNFWVWCGRPCIKLQNWHVGHAIRSKYILGHGEWWRDGGHLHLFTVTALCRPMPLP
jgi:hypothetical protein